MALLLYNLLFPFVFLLLLPRYFARMMRRGNYRHRFGQRFGIYSRRVRQRLAGCDAVWIHAVSVGEVLIARKLAAVLREGEPGLRIVLSTTTSTGFATARADAPDWMECIYNPVDFPFAIGAALRLIRPRAIILVEAEVWPNLVSMARRRGIPVALVNARLSRRSERRFRMFRWFVAPFFGLLDPVCVTSEEDVARWVRLGVKPGAAHCTGSIKFDLAAARPPRPEPLEPVLRAAGAGPGAPILLGGSTHSGEELILARIVKRLRVARPDLFPVIVPRHVERAAEIAQAIRAEGLTPVLRTAIDPGKSHRGDLLIVDTTGELRDWYPLASLVFVGKSLTAKGGQNPIEPAAAGKPVLFGPHMENFEAIAEHLVREGGAFRIDSETALASEIERLLAAPELAHSVGRAAASAAGIHRGSTRRTAELLLGIIGPTLAS